MSMLDTVPSPTASTTVKANTCGGCKLSVESDNGGIVVAFGQSLWHVDCFKCAKCGNHVNADTNLLLLSDGSPVCGSCSYNCSVCKLPIVDEAIMTGDDSYHAMCFTCRQCSHRIEELVFAKTSQGIYCMECHNERAARSRRHHEKKKRAKAKMEREMAGPYGSSRAIPDNATPPASANSTAFEPGTPSVQAASATRSHPGQSRLASSTNGADPRLLSGEASNLISKSSSRSYTVPTLSADSAGQLPTRSSSVDDAGSFAIDGDSLSIPLGKISKRQSLNPGLRLAQSIENRAPSDLSLQHSPLLEELHSTPDPASAVPSPALISTGSLGAHAQASSIPSNIPQEITNGFVTDQYGPVSPTTDTPTNNKRSRSNTPVPSNVDENGRTSDDSDQEGFPTTMSIPAVAVNGSKDHGQSKGGPQPLELSFHDDPAFSNLMSSFGEGTQTKLTLTDPAGSRRSMQALANVALILSEEPTTSPPDTVPSAVSNVSFTTTSAPVEEKGALPALPKASVEIPRISSESRTSSESKQNATLTSTPTWGNPSFTETRPRQNSNASNSGSTSVSRADTADLVTRRLKEALKDATERGATAVKLDREFGEAILHALQGSQTRYADLKGRLDGMKRVSQRMFDGLSVAQEEYDQEVASRRDAEAEITRLRLQLSAQSAQLTALSADTRKRELMEKFSKDMNENLHGLEKDLSKLRVERDLTLAEVEELANNKSASEGAEPVQLTRSLTSRFETLKVKYRRDLEPMIAERETLQREIHELKQAKELCLEETTALVSRNDELLELNVAMARQHENLQASTKSRGTERKASKPTPLPTLVSAPSATSTLSSTPTSGSISSSTVFSDERFIGEDPRYGKGAKSDSEMSGVNTLRKFPWFKGKENTAGGRDNSALATRMQMTLVAPPPPEKPKPMLRHNFQQQSVLRFARCDHCGDKMWGTQLRCAICSTACHTRCVGLVNTQCREANGREDRDTIDITPLPPSMFGRDLTEQVQADARGGPRSVPIIVEKCILAVEARGMEYEGIYRKTGGAGQTKAITQAFERGDHDAFDLLDPDAFNDICSVTSVLKNYFRSLPNPLLTFELHDLFTQAASYRDPTAKSNALANIVDQLPVEHYETLRLLMMHLHGIMEFSNINLMNARNLGVVFGPTLMRSADSAKEFADMAGKALCIEWLIENAPSWTKKSK